MSPNLYKNIAIAWAEQLIEDLEAGRYSRFDISSEPESVEVCPVDGFRRYLNTGNIKFTINARVPEVFNKGIGSLAVKK